MVTKKNESKWQGWSKRGVVARTTALALASASLLGCVDPEVIDAEDPGTQSEELLAERIIRIPFGPVHSYTAAAAWGASSLSDVVLTGDIDGDGDEDLVRFGTTGTFVEVADGGRFQEARRWLTGFGYDDGYRPWLHPRMLADVNGDGKKDIVAFGDDGVWTALSNGTSFAAPAYVLADFGFNQGWRLDMHVRTMADVNGDGRQDLVAFGTFGVSVALSTGYGGFAAPTTVASFGTNQGWSSARHIRLMADVDADGRADVVGFGESGVYVAKSTGTSFGGTQQWAADYSPANGGWSVDRHPRTMADVDGDGRADIVGFGDAGVYVSKSTGTGFLPQAFWLADLGAANAWTTTDHERLVADVNGDKRADIVGFGDAGTHVALAGTDKFTLEPLLAQFGRAQYWRKPRTERILADVNGDGLRDIVGYGDRETLVSLSKVNNKISTVPINPVPITPVLNRLTTTDVALYDGEPMASTEEVLGIAIAYPAQFHRAMRYVYGASYNQPAGELLRRQIYAGDVTVDGLLRDRGGRTDLQGDLDRLGHLFEKYVSNTIYDTPGDEGAMFAMEITNVADQRQAYVEGESAFLRDVGDDYMALYFGPWDWIKDKAVKIARWTKETASDVYDWTADKARVAGRKINEFVEWVGGWNCVANEAGSALTCVACAGSIALEAPSAGAATAAVVSSCGACAFALRQAILECRGKGETPPPPLTSFRLQSSPDDEQLLEQEELLAE